MRQELRTAFYVLLCGLVAYPIIAMAQAATLKERYALFDSQIKLAEKIRDNDAKRYAAAASAFQMFLPQPHTPDSISAMTIDDLNIHLQAISSAAFWTKDSATISQMLIVTEALIEKKAIAPKQLRQLYDVYLSARQFDEAARWQKRFPEVSKRVLPVFMDDVTIKSGEPSEWTMSAKERVSTRQRVDLSRDWMMVVVSHPFCGFSNRATKAIYADAKLANSLKGRTKWVTPQDSNIDIDAFQEWNKEFPDAPVSIVHFAHEWPLEKFSATPTFYFLKAGKVVESFSGWPKEGNFEQLNAALDRLAKP